MSGTVTQVAADGTGIPPNLDQLGRFDNTDWHAASEEDRRSAMGKLAQVEGGTSTCIS